MADIHSMKTIFFNNKISDLENCYNYHKLLKLSDYTITL